MDVELLSKMVGELILDHDEVALPGLGVFVAEMMPATFSDRGYTINPPYRKLSFRQREGADRHLVEFYARANGVDERTAERMVTSFVSSLRESLSFKKSVTLPGLGKLRATRENHFFFVPDEDLNIYIEGFGLVPVSLKSHEETPEEVSETIKSLKEIVSPVAGTESGSQASNAVPAVEPVPETSASVPEPAKPLYEDPAPEKSEVHSEESTGRRLPVWAVVLITIAAVAAVFLAALAILGRVAPQTVDRLLYSPQELEILYRQL